jgi:hypothetical protein
LTVGKLVNGRGFTIVVLEFVVASVDRAIGLLSWPGVMSCTLVRVDVVLELKLDCVVMSVRREKVFKGSVLPPFLELVLDAA